MAGQITVPVDSEEVFEACAVFARWKGRGDELPEALRIQMEAIVTSGRSVEVLNEGPGIAAVLTPEVRALVANLRAREA